MRVLIIFLLAVPAFFLGYHGLLRPGWGTFLLGAAIALTVFGLSRSERRDP